ncbi:MAG: lysine-sensitive aspartokinase 3 [Aestuariibacter sp.]
MKLIVAKFGGTSVANYAAMQNCLKIITNHPKPVLTVLSAPAGVTNHLVTLGAEALTDTQRTDIISQIQTQVTGIAMQCHSSDKLLKQIQLLIDELTVTANHPSAQFNADIKDQLLSFGERFSTLLFTQMLIEAGHEAVNFDVRNVMLTDDQFGQAAPDTEAVADACSNVLLPHLGQHYVVTQGFIGRAPNGKTTTLGRGGSDYSAALLAEALHAERCEIWTDVPGVFTTDPRLVEQAFPLQELSYDEAAEMANFGAKVLHPATLAPTLRKNIPVFVGSSRHPEQGGTLIVKDCIEEPPFRAITRRREQDLVTLHTPKMLRTSKFIGHVFNVLDKHGLSIDLITTSETSISLTFNDPENTTLSHLNQQAIEDLKQICDVQVDEGLDLITLVGNKLHESKGISSTIFSALQSFRVRMICYGANPHNISFLMDKTDSEQAIQVLHKALFNS